MQENTIPWVLKIFPAVIGVILALVLSGDIDKSLLKSKQVFISKTP